jgi:hypothetical protein
MLACCSEDFFAQGFSRMIRSNSKVRALLNHITLGESIVKLPDEWIAQSLDIVSFRYIHPKEASKPDTEEFYFKMIPLGDGKFEVNALSSINNDEIANSEFK